ncbi:MAG: methionyl-tRNA formyltransferase [Acidobacteriota bacterium]|nr:MAG: methionyl-tRNA formyltransferase [Acidobacteriota bacterium]
MKIVFMGTPAAAVASLERLVADGHDVVAVYTQPDRPAGRGQHLTVSPIKEAAMRHGLEVRQPERIKTDEEIEAFRSLMADCAVVVAYGRILPQAMLEAFPRGAINLHFSLLPKYRGAAPVNWAIANGETVTGVTTMKMDAGLDTGDILLQEPLEISDRDTAPQLLERSAVIGGELLSRTLNELDDIVPRRQNDDVASYAPILRKADGLINWSSDASEIERKIRGFKPFPGSFTMFRGKRLVIHDAEAERGEAGIDEPGTIIEAGRNGISVRCGNGSVLKITELQAEGKKRQSASEFANGARVTAEEVFGS